MRERQDSFASRVSLVTRVPCVEPFSIPAFFREADSNRTRNLVATVPSVPLAPCLKPLVLGSLP
jgi:hypothetical protein